MPNSIARTSLDVVWNSVAAVAGALGQMVWYMTGVFQGANAPPPKFEPLDFDEADKWPKPGSTATARETQILTKVVELIEEHAKGLYEAVLMKSHRTGTGVTEAGPLLDPDNFAYLQKPGNLYQQMAELIDGLTENEKRLVYAVLVQADKETATIDQILTGPAAMADDFDLPSTLEKIDPIVEHYLSMKLEPPAHKVPDVDYHDAFMRTAGLRPNTTRLPVTVTKHLAYHASTAILLDALKLRNYPDAHARMQKKFDREKLHARELVWDIATGRETQERTPAYMPTMPDDAFEGVELPPGARIVPALVDIPIAPNVGVETRAAVAVHPHNDRCLCEFLDHTREPPVKRYVVSSDKPPLLPSMETGDVRVFDAHAEAIAFWTEPQVDQNKKGLQVTAGPS